MSSKTAGAADSLENHLDGFLRASARSSRRMIARRCPRGCAGHWRNGEVSHRADVSVDSPSVPFHRPRIFLR